jgi:hypothetical protein
MLLSNAARDDWDLNYTTIQKGKEKVNVTPLAADDRPWGEGRKDRTQE